MLSRAVTVLSAVMMLPAALAMAVPDPGHCTVVTGSGICLVSAADPARPGGPTNPTRKPHRRVTRDFEAEAIRLVETSGRTQKEIATDLGVGLSTLRRWIDKRRERDLEAPPPERQEDMAAELKRLRRENEILRQEREILKRAATFFAKEGSR